MPISTSHWSWPGLTRVLVGLRIGQAVDVDVRASSISFLVRWLMKIGLPRQNTLMTCPSAIGVEIDLDRGAGGDRRGIRVHLRDQRHQRRGAADGADRAGCDVEEIASCRLGRSCCHSPSPSLAGQPTRAENRERIAKQMPMRGGGWAGRLRSWGRTKGGDPAAFIGTLIKRAQARPRPQCTKSSHKSFAIMAIRAIDAARSQGRNDGHADRPLRARHPAEHRHDSAPRGLPRGRGPHRRAGRLSDLGPRLPPRRHGLPRPGVARAPCRLGGIRGLAARPGPAARSCSPPPAATSYLDHAYRPDDILMFGRESAGVPDAVHRGRRRAPA